jgi:hypothetical protein
MSMTLSASVGDLHDEQPSGLLGQTQAGHQADDEIQDQQEQVGQPSEETNETQKISIYIYI